MNYEQNKRCAKNIALICVAVSLLALLSISAFNLFKINADTSIKSTIFVSWISLSYGVCCFIYSYTEKSIKQLK